MMDDSEKMSSLEEEFKSLREKNSELAVEVQHWKCLAAQREAEKLKLMKDVNELRLKLTRLRSGGAAEARKFDAGLQAASEEALSHLVQASGAIARSVELAKEYMRDRQELEASSPRWSNISNNSNSDKIHRVPPTMMGGQSIQPVVSLSRTMLNSSQRSRSPNLNVSVRAVPMHMLQDVYIPLSRVDAAEYNVNNEESEPNNSVEDMDLEDNDDLENEDEDSQNISEELEAMRRLDVVLEDYEVDDEVRQPRRSEEERPAEVPAPPQVDNPLEGPSWLLDVDNANTTPRSSPLEPDSTTPCVSTHDDAEKENEPVAFTPTVRRRKRSAADHDLAAPRHAHRKLQHPNRVLKVVVSKMRLSMEGASPAAKRVSAPAEPGPSHSGATNTAGILCDTSRDQSLLNDSLGAGDTSAVLTHSRPVDRPINKQRPIRETNLDLSSDRSVPRLSCENVDQRKRNRSNDKQRRNREDVLSGNCSVELGFQEDSREAYESDEAPTRNRSPSDSDSNSAANDGRSRRNRKNVTYTEKPLNRKLRR